jgi:Beta protein
MALAQSAFPTSLSKIAKDTTAKLSRAEWTVWRDLVEEHAELPRLPTFADYAAEAPGFFQGDFVDPTAVIRYTINDAWLILRGHNLSEPDGHGQFRQLARQLIAHPQYRGRLMVMRLPARHPDLVIVLVGMPALGLADPLHAGVGCFRPTVLNP